MFSSRLPPALAPNAITRAIAALTAAKTPLLDLTETNPTTVGLTYPDGILTPLGSGDAGRYEPSPLGLRSAREAIARQYGGAAAIDPADIVLTASTSEAYALLFKLLCDAEDEVLVPQPSYPLFESLTRLEGVAARPYRLDYHGAWSINRQSLEEGITLRTRAVLIVSPNNPTGSMLRADDREWLANLCADRDLALISDEVFADYPLRPAPDAASLLGEARTLTFVLGGLSKSAGLPQVKLGWMVISGPDAPKRQAIERLDVICDTYLSVSTPVQVAAPALLDRGRVIRRAIHDRTVANLACLERVIGRSASVSLLLPEGGWSAVMRVPALETEEALVLRLLKETHVIVHPGFFFDFSAEAFLVVSLLPETAVFEDGATRVLKAVTDRAL